jgi:hypothetical protein
MKTSCRLCARQAKLIKAHIIPEAFFRAINRTSGTPLLVSNKAHEPFPKRAPIGVYDTQLLCADCEGLFGPLDDYGARVFLTQTGHFFRDHLDICGRLAVVSRTVDQDLLLRFLVSVLWRASASTISYYERVRLGSAFDALATKAILAWDQPVPPVFSAVLSIWTAGQVGPNETGTMNPFAERWWGINAYRFYFSGFVAYIKSTSGLSCRRLFTWRYAIDLS